jgi:PAS domain S-box-containing protein
LSILLDSKHPMFLAWGPDLISFYNDAYRPIMGARHPNALGQPFSEIWADIWPAISPLVDQALSGQGTWSEDVPLVTYRNGYEEVAYFTFSYSPVRDETGAIAGMLCACTETTRKVHAEAVADRLRESEERYRVLVEAGASVVWRTDPDGKVLSAEGASRIVRQPVVDYLRGAWSHCIHPGDRERVATHWQRLLSSRTSGEAEYRVKAPEGEETRWVCAKAVPLLNQDGTVREWFGTLTDITDTKAAEQALRERKEVLKSALRAGRSAAFEIDLRTGQVARSETALELLGLQPGAHKDFLDHLPDEDREVFSRVAQEARTSGRSEGAEIRFLRADGQTIWLSVRIQATFDENGEAISLSGLGTDITERKNAEAQIAFQASLLDAVEQAVIATDLEGRVVYSNKFTERLYGWTAEEALGHNVAELLSGNAPASAAQTMAFLAQGGSWSGEFIAKRRDGSTFPAYVSDSPSSMSPVIRSGLWAFLMTPHSKRVSKLN